MFDRIEKILAIQREARELKCPKCGHVEDDTETLGNANLITYHGSEDGPIEFECSSCEAVLLVEEDVDRTYEVKLRDGGADV